MAPTQSKLTTAVRERNVRQIVTHLTQLYLSHRTRISRAVYITLFLALVNRVRHAVAEQKAASARAEASRAKRETQGLVEDDEEDVTNKDGKRKRKRVELDREFFRSLLRLLRIVVPGWRSPETRLLISHSFFLVVRTLISLKVAAMDGAIVKSLVKGNGKEFLTRILWWMVIAIPATFTNSMVGLTCFLLPVGRIDRMAADSQDPTLTSSVNPIALLASSRVVAQVSHEVDAAYPRQVSFTTHLLRNIGLGRQDKKSRPAYCCRRGQVLE